MVMTEGADVEALAASVSRIRDYGQRLGTSRAATDEIISHLGIHWTGNDQRAFSNQWNHSYGPALDGCRRMIDDLAHTVSANATEQRTTSNSVCDGAGGLTRSASPQGGWNGEGTSKDKATDAKNASALLSFATDAYGDSKVKLPHGWEEVPSRELASLGLNPTDLVGAEGFRAAVYRDAEGHVVIAFAGTEPTSWKDWATDIAQALGSFPSQYAKAIEIGLKVAQHVGPDNLVLTGHSLGGGLAASASLATGASAITFNAAGVHPNLRHSLARVNSAAAANSDRLIHNYYVDGDPLTELQQARLGPAAVGTQVRMPSALSVDAQDRIHHNAVAAADVGAAIGRSSDPLARLPFVPSLAEMAGERSGYAVGRAAQTELERHNVSGVKSSLDAFRK